MTSLLLQSGPAFRPFRAGSMLRHPPQPQKQPVGVRCRRGASVEWQSLPRGQRHGKRMRLLNPDMAIVDAAKVREYLLSTTHSAGRFKAVFCPRLGFTQDAWTEPREALTRDHARPGTQYVDSSARGYDRPGLTSIRIIRTGKSVARFVTTYPSSSP